MSSKSNRPFSVIYIKPRMMPAVRAYIPRKKPSLIGTCVLQFPKNRSVGVDDINSYITKLRPGIEEEAEVFGEKYDQYDQIYLQMKPDKTVTEEFLQRICR